jgi:hypothetical protein
MPVKNAWSKVKTTLGIDIEKRASHIADGAFAYVTHSKREGFLGCTQAKFWRKICIHRVSNPSHVRLNCQ